MNHYDDRYPEPLDSEEAKLISECIWKYGDKPAAAMLGTNVLTVCRAALGLPLQRKIRLRIREAMVSMAASSKKPNETDSRV